jgi:hypothetical protein
VVLDGRQYGFVHFLPLDAQSVRAGLVATGAATGADVMRDARLILRVSVGFDHETTAADTALGDAREQIGRGTLRWASGNLAAQLAVLEPDRVLLDQFAPLGDAVPEVIGHDAPVRLLDALPLGLRSWTLLHRAHAHRWPLLRPIPDVDTSIVLPP